MPVSKRHVIPALNIYACLAASIVSLTAITSRV
jgi:hypothetical protein